MNNSVWQFQWFAGNLGGNPKAIARSSGNIDVFYTQKVNTLNTLWDTGWDVTYGWTSGTTPLDGAVGDPAPVARTSGKMDIFRNSDGKLAEATWDSATGWSGSLVP